VTALLDAQGNTLYRNESASKAVLSPATADTMNKLLQGVVSPTGTGAKANCGDIQVAGKTGTGDDYDTCWFVGITPEYSCAVLMTGDTENRAPILFASAIQGIYEANPRLNKNFITHKNLYQVVYCTQSGLAIGDNCTSIGLGYYVSTDALAICNIHE
jgi:penicillin-binding protein 1A